MNLRTPGCWIEFEEVESTQTVAIERLRQGLDVGVVFAHHQTGGRGRFGREWVSRRGDSLTFTAVFTEVSASQPWLVGMGVACCCAEVLSCQLRWPNDLVLGKEHRKLGGILTEMIEGFAVVGVGVNLGAGAIPIELRSIATHLSHSDQAKVLAERLVQAFEALPTPAGWDGLAPTWLRYDATPGKGYRLPSGDLVTAQRVGAKGQLIATDSRGAELHVMAADALFGDSTTFDRTSSKAHPGPG